MNRLLAIIACFGVLAAGEVANGLEIRPDTGVLNTSRWEGNETSEKEIKDAISDFIGSATLQYQADVGGPESKALNSSYDTVFSNTSTDPSDANITYVGGDAVAAPAFLLVKDGNQTPAWYLFDLTALGWTGTETLELRGFWPAQGAISHVSLWGDRESVPDGGITAMLLGLSLLGLRGFFRRKN